jgi:hypothetical protein
MDVQGSGRALEIGGIALRVGPWKYRQEGYRCPETETNEAELRPNDSQVAQVALYVASPRYLQIRLYACNDTISRRL